MSTFPQRKSDYSQKLILELLNLVEEFDNKGSNFLVSTLVTGVLTYHLSWVHTVAPPEGDRSGNCRHGNYDPLWAQLSDLYGYVGTPARISRTIVVGQDMSIVRRILYILTYLIRCNEVYENLEAMSEPSSDNIFSRERDYNDDAYICKLEDKIVRQLIGSSTDVESIAIPKTHGQQDVYRPSESPESLTDNSNSTSLSSTPNLFPTSHWSLSTTDTHCNTSDKLRRPKEPSSSSSDRQDLGESAVSLDTEQILCSPDAMYPVTMPK
jgi:hypothetical protein